MNVCASLLVCACVSWVSMHRSVSVCRQDQVGRGMRCRLAYVAASGSARLLGEGRVDTGGQENDQWRIIPVSGGQRSQGAECPAVFPANVRWRRLYGAGSRTWCGGQAGIRQQVPDIISELRLDSGFASHFRLLVRQMGPTGCLCRVRQDGGG